MSEDSLLAMNASVAAEQTVEAHSVLAGVDWRGWRQGAGVLLLVAALLFVCSRKLVSSSAGQLAALLKELGRKRVRLGLADTPSTPAKAAIQVGDEEEQRVSAPHPMRADMYACSQTLIHTTLTCRAAICCPLLQDKTRRRGKKFTQSYELEPLMRTDSESSAPPSGDELSSPIPRQQPPPPLPLLRVDQPQHQPLLSTRFQSALLPHLPPLLAHVPQWQLVYSTSVHGHSLSEMYRRSEALPAVAHDGALLLCRDSDGWVFGCWTSERWERHSLYYGGSESFVFTCLPAFKVYEAREETRRKRSRERRQSRDAAALQHDLDDPSAEQKQQRESEDEEEADEEKAEGGSGAGYYQLAKAEHIALGGGERFALWLDSAFRDGTSGPCTTFDSPTLSKRPQFKCYELEVWGM